jgi:tetratricopeptide (TPR) repeat protein
MPGCFLTISGASLTNKNIMKSLLYLLLTVFAAGEPCVAQDRTIDSLRLLLGASKADTSTIKLMADISYYYRNIKPDTGVAYGQRALQLAQKINWKPGMGRSYNCIGLNYFSLTDPTKALQSHQKALETFEQIHDTDGTAWSLKYLSSVHLFILSDYQKASDYLESSLKLFQQINDIRGMAQGFDDLGIVYEIKGENTKSLQFFQQAEKKDEEIGDKRLLATNASHLGILYTDLKEYPKALEYCKKALDYFTSVDFKRGIASALSSIGTIYVSTNKYDEALQYYQKSKEMSDLLGNKFGSAQGLGNMGLAYAGLRKYNEALKCYQQSYDLENTINDKADMAKNLSNIGYIYINAPDTSMNRLGYPGTKRYSIAANTVKQSLQLQKEVGDLYAQRVSLKFLSTIYAKQKDFANAYKTFEDYAAVNDSVYADEKQKQITHKEIEYEFSKKEELLKAEQGKKDALALAEISRQKIIRNYTIASVAIVALFTFFLIVAYNKRKKAKFDRQVSEVEMQAMRLQMNPHFIFNCMHSINKYVMDNEKQLASEFLIRFSKLMRLILENSREKSVPVKADLLTLEMYMQLEALRFKHKFNYSISVDPAIDTEKTLIPPMLLQPFVENAIVHGIQNRAGGLIKINISKEGEMIRCTVEDNGIGRKQAALFKSTTETQKQSLGVKITRERLQIISQLKKVKTAIFMEDLVGTDNSNNGLRVELLLPLETEF